MSLLDDLKDAMGRGHEKADKALLWLAAIHHNGEVLLSAIEQQQEQTDYHRLPAADVADSNGQVVIRHRVKSGGWKLISIAITGDTPTANTGCFVYRNDINLGENLLHVVTYGSKASDEFSTGEYIGENEYLYIVFVGQTPGVRCTATVKYLNLIQQPRLVSGEA